MKTTADALGQEQAEITALVEDESSNLEAVRSIEPTLLNWKYIFVAFLVLLAAALVHALTRSLIVPDTK